MLGFGKQKTPEELRKQTLEAAIKKQEQQKQQSEARLAELAAKKEALEQPIREYNERFDDNIKKIETYLAALENIRTDAAATPAATASATPAATASATPAASLANAEAALTAVVGDINNYATKSPLAYLLKTNKELLAKAKSELENIKGFTRKAPIRYARDAKFPSTGLFSKTKGGAKKTRKNKQVL